MINEFGFFFFVSKFFPKRIYKLTTLHKKIKLNRDILYLLFEELQSDPKSLFSCLLVNRLWCETVVPILWKNPWRYEDKINYQNNRSLYYIITYYLSDDIKEFLTKQ